MVERFNQVANNDPEAFATMLVMLSLSPASIAAAPYEEKIAQKLREEGFQPEVYIDAFITQQMDAFLAGETTPELAINRQASACSYATLKVTPRHLRSEVNECGPPECVTADWAGQSP